MSLRAKAGGVAILAVLACAGIVAFAFAASGRGGSSAPGEAAAPALGAGGSVRHAHPQAIEPVAGAAAGPAGPAATNGAGGPSAVSVGPPSGGGALAQPVSDAQVRAELAASGLSARAGQATLTSSGLALAPAGAPAVVQQVIAAGNQIAHLPYRFGGGHGTFEDTAYDCSGSLSFVFAAAGLLGSPMTSGDLESWGRQGRGKWITVFANAGHTFMYIAGLRFDTVALAETGSRWSNRSATEGDAFAVRHPQGL
ncbi:MAG: hypothetical protein ACR2IP_13145 [Solirubrobacteraceae bacterium]